MGFYIDAEGMELGRKAEWLIANAKATELNSSGIMKVAKGGLDIVPKTHMLVCVVDNGTFDAAGICFDAAEFDAFAHPDGRRKRWLIVPKDELVKTNPYIKDQITGEKPWRY